MCVCVWQSVPGVFVSDTSCCDPSVFHTLCQLKIHMEKQRQVIQPMSNSKDCHVSVCPCASPQSYSIHLVYFMHCIVLHETIFTIQIHYKFSTCLSTHLCLNPFQINSFRVDKMEFSTLPDRIRYFNLSKHYPHKNTHRRFAW